MIEIKIILGSSRPNRFAHQPGEWLQRLGADVAGARFEMLDLAEINLPFLDEPALPGAPGYYQHEHTRQWAEMIDGADGFVLVAPEYNHGYTPVLKNALDYLYDEWLHKPVAFASYGGAAGGARAVEQLRGVVGNLAMYDLSEHVILPGYASGIDKDGVFDFTERHDRTAQGMLRELVFWADVMKRARQDKASQ